MYSHFSEGNKITGSSRVETYTDYRYQKNKMTCSITQQTVYRPYQNFDILVFVCDITKPLKSEIISVDATYLWCKFHFHTSCRTRNTDICQQIAYQNTTCCLTTGKLFQNNIINVYSKNLLTSAKFRAKTISRLGVIKNFS